MNEFNVQTPPLQNVVFSIALSPNFVEDGVCFAASTEGLLVSRDGGQTWKQYNALLAGQVTTVVAPSPSYSRDGRLFVGMPGGILISSDDGEVWRTAIMPRETPQISAIVCSPTFSDDGIVFAATDGDGVFCSTNRGNAWEASNFGLLDLSVISLAVSPAFADDKTLFAGTSTGLFLSKNGGRAWHQADMGQKVTVLAVAYSPNFTTDGLLCIGTEEGSVFRSTDRGRTWQVLGEVEGNWPINAIAVTTMESGDSMPIIAAGEGLWVWDEASRQWQSAVKVEEPICFTLLPTASGDDVAALVGTAQGTVERRRLQM